MQNSDDESELSELDDNQFGHFDPENIAIEERPVQIIDETNVNLIGAHKRKRAEGEEVQKKKKNKREKPRRGKKAKEDDEGEGGERRSKRARKVVRTKGATPDSDADEDNLTPEERKLLRM